MKTKFVKIWNRLLIFLRLKRKPLISGLGLIVPINYDEFIKKYPDLVNQRYTTSSEMYLEKILKNASQKDNIQRTD